MNRKICNFISIFISSVTIIISLIILVLDNIDIFDEYITSDHIQKAILSLLTFFSITTLLLLHSKFNDLKDSQKKQFENTIKSLNGVEVNQFRLDEDGFIYMANKIKNSKRCIEHAAFSPPVASIEKKRNLYDRTIQEILSKNKVTYRYVARLGEYSDDGKRMRRLDHLIELLSNDKIKKYTAFYYLFDPNYDKDPSASFMIIDNSELFALYPNSYSEQEIMLSIKHPDIIEMYSQYFKHLTANGHRLTLEDACKLEHKFLKNN